MAMKCLPPGLLGRQITILTSNQAALLAVSQPKQQSGQTSIAQVYDAVRKLRQGGNGVRITWVPTQEFELGKEAKGAANSARTLLIAAIAFTFLCNCL